MNFTLALVIILAFLGLRKIFFYTKIGKSIKYRKTVKHRLERFAQRELGDSNLKREIICDVKTKTGFDLSGAELVAHIDYSTFQLGHEEVYFQSEIVEPYLEQTCKSDWSETDIVWTKKKITAIINLAAKFKHNKRISRLNSTNRKMLDFRAMSNEECFRIKSYHLSDRGGDEFHQGDISIDILPECKHSVNRR